MHFSYSAQIHARISDVRVSEHRRLQMHVLDSLFVCLSICVVCYMSFSICLTILVYILEHDVQSYLFCLCYSTVGSY